jgi:hypothetical protein
LGGISWPYLIVTVPAGLAAWVELTGADEVVTGAEEVGAFVS